MAKPSTMLWRSADAPHATLLGSIHILDDALPEWAIAAHQEADMVVFEIDYSQMPSRFPEMPGEGAISALSRELGDALAAECRRLNLDEDVVDRLFPFCAAVVLGGNDLPEGASAALGVESVLFGRSPCFGALESVEDQIRALITPPIEEQLIALDLHLAKAHERSEHLRQAMAAWKEGDLSTVWQAMDFPELEKRCSRIMDSLYSRRHLRWGSLAARYIENSARAGEQLLIIAGCGHFVGPESFCVELERYGYRFEQQ